MENLIRHPEFGEIRTVTVKGEPWFVAQDICEVLGIKWKGYQSLGFLDEDEAGSHKMGVRSENGVTQQRDVVIINESGLYTLMMRSYKPSAKKFRKWVTSEVLPSIRKFGYYVHPDLMEKKHLNLLEKDMRDMLRRYLTDADYAMTERKFGMPSWCMVEIVSGSRKHNAIMQELQRRALANKKAEINAYAPERMRKVMEVLQS